MAAVADPRLALMGGAPTQGNLRAVRARAQDLQKSIDEVIFGLRFNAGVLKWDDIIRKYSVINTQLAGLREALRPGTLDGFALLPRLVPDPGFAEAVTVQLASALTPEGETAAAEAAAAVDAALGLGPEMPSMQRFEILNSAIEAHNNLISALTGPAGAGGGQGSSADGPLSPQGPLKRRQRELSDATAAVLQSKARAAAAAATALAAAMSGAPAAVLASGGGRQQAAIAGPPARRGLPNAAAGGPAGGAGAAAGGGPGGGGSEPVDPAVVFILTGVR